MCVIGIFCPEIHHFQGEWDISEPFISRWIAGMDCIAIFLKICDKVGINISLI